MALVALAALCLPAAVASAAGVDVARLMASQGMAQRYEPARMAYVFSGNGHRAELVPGSAQMLFDSTFIELSQPAFLRDGRIYTSGELPYEIRKILGDRPAPAATSTYSGLTLNRIMIDAGHGGHDPGATDNGLREKDITLDVALKLGQILKARGWTVQYTRSNDTFVDLDERAAMANRSGAELFVAIHVNSASSSRASGYETYHLRKNFYDNVDRGIEAAQAYSTRPGLLGMTDPPSQSLEPVLLGVLFEEYQRESNELARSIQDSLAVVIPTANRGVKTAGFRVMSKSNCPNCLVEAGFISNPAEAARLGTAEYRQKVAQAIAGGIERFRTKLNHTNGSSQ